MLRALLWKEWREQRAIAFAGAAVALMIPLMTIAVAWASGAPDFLDVADVVPFLFGIIVWPLFAALAGATVNSERASDATAGFLLSRPVPRPLLWLIKVAIGAVATAFVVALSFYVALRIDLGIAGWGFDFPFSADPFSWPPDRVVQTMAIGALYITFAGAVFLSTILRRAVAAAIGGLCLGVVSPLGMLVIAGRIGPIGPITPGVEPFLELLSICLAAVLLLASFYVFRSAGSTADARRACAGIGLSLPIIILAAGFITTRADFDTADIRYLSTVPGTDTSIVGAAADSFAGMSLWALEPGGEPRRLTRRHARMVALSPDGEWLVYASALGPLGTWRRGECDLRAVRVDGTEDHFVTAVGDHVEALGMGYESAVYAGQRCFWSAAFSPAGHLVIRLAPPEWHQVGSLMVFDIQGGLSRTIDLSGIPDGSLDLSPDWPARDSALLYSPYEPDRGVWEVDIETGAIESVYRSVDDVTSETLASSASRLLIHEVERRPRSDRARDPSPLPESTKLIELPRRMSREIGPLCGAPGDRFLVAAMARDGEHMAYACRAGRLPSGDEWEDVDAEALFRGALRLRNLTTGEEETLAELDGYIYQIEPSPDGSRWLVMLADPRGQAPRMPRQLAYTYGGYRRIDFRYVLIEADRSLRPLDITPEWYRARWLRDDRLLLQTSPRRQPGGPSTAFLELRERGVELRLLHQRGGG